MECEDDKVTTEPRPGNRREWVSRRVGSPPSLPFVLHTSLHLSITRALYAWHSEDKVTHLSQMTADKSLLLDLRSAQTCLPAAPHSGSSSSACALRPSYSGNGKCSAVERVVSARRPTGELGNTPPPELPMESEGASLPPVSQSGRGAGPERNKGCGAGPAGRKMSLGRG